ncbi:MAG TPA: helix-turn-helix transcriptional regulator [Terriglobia bacterium]|nr:helix-turn-helix transcriptional regulator [Terriglobia bacterium]
MRHFAPNQYDPKPGVSISTLAYEYPAGYNVPEHAHDSDQLIYATRGVMEVSACQRLWLTPPHLALWIPARTRHRIRMPREVSMRTLYLKRGLVPGAPEVCTVIHVSPLFRELVVEAVRIGHLRMKNRLHCALRDLIVSQLQNASPVPMFVALPQDSRALGVAQAFIANQADTPSLDAMCRRVGVSVRTIQRTFRREVGTTFEFWRRQMRLMKGIELLVEGCSVKVVAAEVGYRQPSAFVELFRQTLGMTPKAWASALHGKENRTTPKSQAMFSGLHLCRTRDV